MVVVWLVVVDLVMWSAQQTHSVSPPVYYSHLDDLPLSNQLGLDDGDLAADDLLPSDQHNLLVGWSNADLEDQSPLDRDQLGELPPLTEGDDLDVADDSSWDDDHWLGGRADQLLAEADGDLGGKDLGLQLECLLLENDHSSLGDNSSVLKDGDLPLHDVKLAAQDHNDSLGLLNLDDKHSLADNHWLDSPNRPSDMVVAWLVVVDLVMWSAQ